MLDKLTSGVDSRSDSRADAGALAVLVVGMHRSGTSALTGVLSLLGIEPPDQQHQADQHNVRGYFEPQRIIDFHEALFAKLGSPSNDPLPLSYDWVRSPLGQAAAEELARLLDDEFAGQSLRVFKDPRMCRLMPLWTEALARAGLDAVAVLPCRNPLEVAGSLQAKGGLLRPYALFMWLQHVVLGERFTRGMRRSFTLYDDLMSDWRSVAAKLEHDLGLSWPRDIMRAGPEIDAFLSGDLRHHQAQDEKLIAHDALHALCGRTWDLMARLRDDADDREAQAALDQVWVELEGGLGLFGPLVVNYQREVAKAVAYGEAVKTEKDSLGDIVSRQAELLDQQARHLGALDWKLAERERRLVSIEDRFRERDWQVMDLNRRLAGAEAEKTRLQGIEQSTFWKITRPVRSALLRFPQLRRAGRALILLSWWTVSLQLPARLKARKQAIAAMHAAAPPAIAPAAPAEHGAGPTLPAFPLHQRRIRIVFVSGEAHTPGHKYRVQRWMEAARQIGCDVRVLPLAHAPYNRHLAADADLLFVWRAAWDSNLEALVHDARLGATPVLFDVDDLMFEPSLAKAEIIDGIRSQDLTEESVAEFYRRVEQSLAAADYASAPTPLLAERMRHHYKPAFVLPNGFDDDVFLRSRAAARRWREERDGLVRLGYATGSKTHQKDFEQCAGAVARILRTHPQTRLVLFRAAGKPVMDIAEFPQLAGLEGRVEWRDLVPIENLPDELARFDINLAPLEVGNLFCEAKSELKFFEAALVDVPTVASPTEPYRRAIRSGENGFLADGEAAWYAALKQLIEEPDLRRRVVRAAFYDSLADFGPERRAQLFHAMLEQIVRGGQAGASAFEVEMQKSADGRERPRPHVPPHRVVFASDRIRPSHVTVVVPLYNYANYVIEALDSVRDQTLADLDLIVVDDASTDDSLEIARRWIESNVGRFNRVLLLQNTPNAGLGFTRNVGFENAETPFVIPLDADNRFLPHLAEKALADAQRTGAAFVYPGIRQFGDATERMGEFRYDPARFVGMNYIDAMALIRTSAWAAVGGYDNVRYGWEDYDLWCRFAEQGYFGHQMFEVLAQYRVHGKSMLRSETDLEHNKVELIQDMERRHPWLRINKPPYFAKLAASPRRAATASTPSDAATSDAAAAGAPAQTTAPSPGPAPSPEARAGRLAAILPLLRCPVTGAALERDGDGLRSVDGERSWPLLDGRPVLFEGLDEPRVIDADHASNPLPARARALIEATAGPVLHLSAGASERRWDHVVEAEFALFANTDVLADAHALPFADASFDLVVSMNAFEHYHTPTKVAAEILRVLKPGGRVFIHTAFMQPLHEAPWHFYNSTRYGVEHWFRDFEKLDLKVSDNFNPIFALSWQLSEAEIALRRDLSDVEADRFLAASTQELVEFWRRPDGRDHLVWKSFTALPQATQEQLAAGFEFLGQKPG